MSQNSMPAVLLAHSYYLHADAKQLRRMKPYPPLATLLTAAMLRERGHDVRLFDAMLAGGEHEFADLVQQLRPPIVGLFEDNFNFLTKMCTVRMREAALAMIGAAKAVGARIAVNGSDASDRPALYLDAGADTIIVGEVEETAAELFDLWTADRNASPAGIPGLLLPGAKSADDSAGTSPRRTAARARIQDLDAYPFPAWDLLDVDRYRAAWTRAHGRFSWNMVSSRGCPYGCNWCAKPIFGRLYTQRSPAGVAEEMRQLRDRVAPDHVWFADDIFGVTPSWIESFAREVTERDARIPFMMQSRANLMKPATVSALSEAGAEEVWMGVESGSQRILDAMHKGTYIEQIRAATRTLRDHGIRAGWFIQLGYLGEEWADIVATRELLRAERPDEIGVSVAYPLPGTGFYDIVQQQLGLKRNWMHSGDLSMMFAGTYDSGFYRAIRDLLHDEADAGFDAGERAAIDRRWARLERAEGRHRNSPRDVAASSA